MNFNNSKLVGTFLYFPFSSVNSLIIYVLFDKMGLLTQAILRWSLA